MYPFFLLFLAVSLLTRVALLLYTGRDEIPMSLWPGLFARGLFFDLAVLAWLAVPFLLGRALWPRRWHWPRLGQPMRPLLFFAGSFLLLFVALAEVTFWLEFSTRFNFIAVNYLIYTQEVLGNIRESYPVGRLLAAIAVMAALLTWGMRRWLTPRPPLTRRGRFLATVLAFLLPFLSWRFVDLDQMAFSDNAYANELAGNGLYGFAAALRRNDLPYDRLYATLPPEQADAILRELGVEREPLSSALLPDADETESFDAQRLPFARPPRNVVLIIVESLSADFLGVFGNPEGLTPRLDALAGQGFLFTNLYATGTRTVRGLEAVTLGTPPIPGQAIVRRPNNDHLATLGEILRRQGFETFFFYGGYGYFDNMNAFFAGNDYRVFDRTDIPREAVGFANVWGVADEYLFDYTLTRLDAAHAAGKPFLAQVMTTSNHRPYTYPDGRIGIPSPGGRRGAVQYTDYAIGRFIDQARGRPWFSDTLFIIVADHCASAAGKSKLSVPGYHIPLILYAPHLLRPGRDTRLASQIDIPPTVLDVLGLPGDDHFYGQSLFESNRQERAFIANYQELGYLKDGLLTVLGPKRRIEAYRIDETGLARPAAVETRHASEAIAYYQSTYQAFRTGALKLSGENRP